MAKLISTINADRFGGSIENWLLDNELRLSIGFPKNGETAVFSNYEIFISSLTGDVADQVFEKLHKIELFKDMKLVPIACYIIILDKSLLKEFFAQVELIDSSLLKEGKSY